MKNVKLLIVWFLVIFLVTACLANPRVTGPQSEVGDPDSWQTYNNDHYKITVQYPPAWQVIELPTPEYPTATDQVWFISENLPQPQTASKADIVFIFSREDPSPNWESQYFDEYQTDTIQLGDTRAIRISGINKESRYSETVVLAKMGEYYLQALPNLGEQSQAYFDQVVSSIRSTQEESMTPSPLATNDFERTVTFEGISITFPEWLAWGTTGNKISGFVDPSGFMYNDFPEHVRFDFSKSYTERTPFIEFQPGWVPWLNHQNPENSEIVPQIFVFPTEAYAEISPMAGERIETLKTLLADDVIPESDALPVLPTFNSTQDLRAQLYPLTFQGGRGLRFITRYSQGVDPVVNPHVFYTFQGMTDDGHLYVAAFFPLFVPDLSEQLPVDDWDAFNRGYQDYMAEITTNLEQLNPDDFEPSLESLDHVIESINISIPAQPISTPTEFSVPSNRSATEPPCFVTGFSPVAFTPDSQRLLFKAENGVQIFNLQTMEEEKYLEAPSRLLTPAVALSPDGEILAWALEDFSIQLIRISDNKLLHTLTGHTDLVGKLIFSPDGDRLFSTSHDNGVRVWDMEGNLVDAYQPPGALGYPNEALGIGVSPDGAMLATISSDGPVKLWDLEGYRMVRELGSFGGYDTSDITFSPDGQLVASDTANGLFLWQTSDGTELFGGNPGINSMAVAFSPDGRFLAYGEIGEKFDVMLRSPDGTQEIRTLEGHPAPVGILFFSPDSSLLLSSDWVETRIWGVTDGGLKYIGKSSCP